MACFSRMAARLIGSQTTSQILVSVGDSTETFLANIFSPQILARPRPDIRSSFATHLTGAKMVSSRPLGCYSRRAALHKKSKIHECVQNGVTLKALANVSPGRGGP